MLKQRTFADWAEKNAGHDEGKVLAALGPVLECLKQMHAEGKAHGNIQPQHLLVLQSDQIDLVNFTSQKTEKMDRNSPYAPPEAYDDPPSPATPAGDVYALAAVLYHALGGQPPISASTRRDKRLEKLRMEIKPGALVAQALEKGLALRWEARPRTAGAFRDLLKIPPSPSAVRPDAGKAAPAPNKGAAPSPPPASSGLRLVERLPVNLTVSRPFEIKMADLFKEPHGGLKVEFVNAEELGFRYDREKDVLAGTPRQAGEQKLRVEVTRTEADGRRIFEKSIAVTINPDPDSLWKNLPSDEKDPYYKPDAAQADIFTPQGRMLAASLRGRSHAHEGLFRDDDFQMVHHEPTGWHLLAVADGAGSARYSRRGSQLACKEALRFLQQWLETQPAVLAAAVQALGEKGDGPLRTAAYSWLGGAAFEARKAIEAEAKAHQPPATVRDYATTLLLAAALPTPAGWLVAAFTIGDGGIALLRADGQVKALCTPDSGEFSGQTVFLTATGVLGTAEQIMQRIHTACVPDLAALVLMTDGVTDPKFPTETSLGDPAVWKAFWLELQAAAGLSPAHAEAAPHLLQWLSFRSPGNHDDRTIALLLPGGRTSPASAPALP